MKTNLTKRQIQSMADRMLERARTTSYIIDQEEKTYLHYGGNACLLRYFKLSQLLKIQVKAYNRLKNYSYNCKK